MRVSVSVKFLFAFLFLNSTGSASFFHMKKSCIPSSCGNLSFPEPFRLSSDSQDCGRPEYELICEGGKHTFLYLDRHRYLVLNVSVDGYITVRADCAFTTGTCRLEGKSVHNFNRFVLETMFWPLASFVNCSHEIQSKDYMVVPWLSSNSSTVYVTVGQVYTIEYLPKFCRFLDTFPFTPHNKPNSSIEVINTLKSGLELEPHLWFPVLDAAKPFATCWYDLRREASDWVGTGNYRYLRMILFPVLVWAGFLYCHGLFRMGTFGFVLRAIAVYSMFVLSVLFVLALICRFLLVPLSVCAFLVHSCWKNTRPVDDIEKFLRSQQSLSPIRYSFANIASMTRNFKEKLGKGGFGSVFKGELLGSRLVAVKVLGSLKFSGEDFINEVSTIGRIHHVNVVQLTGFCSEGTKRALIYEYMPNGSLDKYIFSSNGTLALEQLNKIALGVARGIDYLHRGCDMQILHFDIKPHNILLDRDFTPKISDFGLAKMYPREHSLVSVSAGRGTIGYIVPELISRNFGVISYKSDVYSFGMLLPDIAGKRRDFNAKMQNSSEVYYPSWIYNQLTQQEVPNFEGTIEISESERKLCKVGMWCIQMDSSKRPSMGKVIEMLEADEDHIEIPPKPFFSSIEERSEHSCLTPSLMELSVTIEQDK